MSVEGVQHPNDGMFGIDVAQQIGPNRDRGHEFAAALKRFTNVELLRQCVAPPCHTPVLTDRPRRVDFERLHELVEQRVRRLLRVREPMRCEPRPELIGIIAQRCVLEVLVGPDVLDPDVRGHRLDVDAQGPVQRRGLRIHDDRTVEFPAALVCNGPSAGLDLGHTGRQARRPTDETRFGKTFELGLALRRCEHVRETQRVRDDRLVQPQIIKEQHGMESARELVDAPNRSGVRFARADPLVHEGTVRRVEHLSRHPVSARERCTCRDGPFRVGICESG
ncbi:MAG TPA: hypothetical protein VFF40_03460 [Acidimicrobiia bacterium]|nr:hypothetical protein [Acidimicrobiia bacterium]